MTTHFSAVGVVAAMVRGTRVLILVLGVASFDATHNLSVNFSASHALQEH